MWPRETRDQKTWRWEIVVHYSVINALSRLLLKDKRSRAYSVWSATPFYSLISLINWKCFLCFHLPWFNFVISDVIFSKICFLPYVSTINRETTRGMEDWTVSGSMYWCLEGLGVNRTLYETSVLDARIGVGENGSCVQVSYVNEFGICKYVPTICWVWQKARESCSVAFKSHLLSQHDPATVDCKKKCSCFVAVITQGKNMKQPAMVEFHFQHLSAKGLIWKHDSFPQYKYIVPSWQYKALFKQAGPCTAVTAASGFKNLFEIFFSSYCSFRPIHLKWVDGREGSPWFYFHLICLYEQGSIFPSSCHSSCLAIQ